MAGNFERMIALVNEFFDTRNDPDQISVTEEQREHLAQIHPNTLSEVSNDDGPIVWILLFPTLQGLMQQFLTGSITERQLLEQTPVGGAYDCIYLCSASVLPEFRHKGLAMQTTLNAVNEIRSAYNIKSLFYWPFSEEGRHLAQKVATITGLPLYERKE
jgi:hypothetical protein